MQNALFLLLLGLALSACSASAESEIIGTFRNTYYYIAFEDDYLNEVPKIPLYTMNDQVLAVVRRSFYNALKIEGTGKLHDGRIVNFAGIKKGTVRYHVTPHEFGDGVGSCGIIPFHSIAVDPTQIPLGSLVMIDETVDMILPDGTFHNGLWRAEDVGSAIKGDHIDLFTGSRHDARVLQAHGITHMQRLTVRMVEPPTDSSCVHQLETY